MELASKTTIDKLSRLNICGVTSRTKVADFGTKFVLDVAYQLSEKWDPDCCMVNVKSTKDKFTCFKNALRSMELAHLQPTIKQLKQVKSDKKTKKTILRIFEAMIDNLEKKYLDLYTKTHWPKPTPKSVTKEVSPPKPAFKGYTLPDNIGENDVPMFKGTEGDAFGGFPGAGNSFPGNKPSNGGFPANNNSSGGFPANNSNGGFPANNSNGGFPANNSNGGFPANAATKSNGNNKRKTPDGKFLQTPGGGKFLETPVTDTTKRMQVINLDIKYQNNFPNNVKSSKLPKPNTVNTPTNQTETMQVDEPSSVGQKRSRNEAYDEKRKKISLDNSISKKITEDHH
eukprot:UN31837